MLENAAIVAKTIRGLESPLAEELREMGAENVQQGERFVSFSGDRRMLYRVALACRTAVRILLPVHTFPIGANGDPAEIVYAGAAQVDWSKWLDANGTLAVDAIVPERLFANSMFAALVVKDAVVDQFRAVTGTRPNIDRQRPDLRIHLFISAHAARLFIDASGDSLHRRGYRRAAGEAPLNEVLAAGLLHLSGWRADQTLVDFMCGSGTIAIEAALAARRMPPGLIRAEFGFERWPDFDRATYDAVAQQLRAASRQRPPAEIFASDVDAGAIEMARRNAERAGVARDIQFALANFEALTPPAESGVAIVNPPYDERLRTRHAAAFYRRLGQVLQRNWHGWHIHLLSGYLPAEQAMDLPVTRSLRLFNGPIKCRFLSIDLTDRPENDAPVAVRHLPTPHTAASLLLPASWQSQVQAFTNRLARMSRHWLRAARRQGWQAVRLYDRDIPEVPLSVEWYAGRVHLVEHDRPHARSPVEHEQWREGVVEAVAAVLEIPRAGITVERAEDGRPRPRDGGLALEICEGDGKYAVRLADDQSSGLEIDERGLRRALAAGAGGKRMLSLFAEAGAMAVAAASGGAGATLAVEPERAWLPLLQANQALIDRRSGTHRFHLEDVAAFLDRCAAEAFDLVCLAPPQSFGVSPDRPPWDVRPAYLDLLDRLAPCIAPGGVVYVASRSGRPILRPEDLPCFTLRDVRNKLSAPDCRRGPRIWSLVKVAATHATIGL